MPNEICATHIQHSELKKIGAGLIVFFLLQFISFNSYSQKGDSLTNTNKNFSIITAGQIYSHSNGGAYYKGHDVYEKNSYYHRILLRPMVSHNLGIRYKNLFQLIDFCYQSREGEYNLKSDYGHDELKMTYIGYQVWYDFLPKIKFPIKPLAAINISYIDKKYEFSQHSSWGGGNSNTNLINDHSKTIFIQIPVGFYFLYKSFFVSCSYYLPLISWTSGNLKHYIHKSDLMFPTINTTTTEKYSGNSTSKYYESMKHILSIKIGCSLNFKNK
jgi:hypothetical protein